MPSFALSAATFLVSALPSLMLVSVVVLTAWRAELSLGLLEARVGSVYEARAKQRKKVLLEEGVTEEELKRQIPIYRVCTTRSVLDEFAQVARAGHSFWRMLGAV